jgi:hypothetical protein
MVRKALFNKSKLIIKFLINEFFLFKLFGVNYMFVSKFCIQK